MSFATQIFLNYREILVMRKLGREMDTQYISSNTCINNEVKYTSTTGTYCIYYTFYIVIIFPVEWKSVLLFVKFDYWTFINIIKYFVNKRSTKYISNLNFIFLNPDVIWIFWLFIWANSKIFRLLGSSKFLNFTFYSKNRMWTLEYFACIS